MIHYWPDDDCIESKLVASSHIDSKLICFDWS